MITVILPDGSESTVQAPATGQAVVDQTYAKAQDRVMAVTVDDEVWDLTRDIEDGAQVKIITRDDEATLDLMRHSAAHIMAQAVKELYPEVQVTIGPVIENGFYYDFDRAEPFTPDDLQHIEKRMHEIVSRKEPVVREVWARDDAIDHFRSIGEDYKAEIISDIPAGDTLTVYRQGEFRDLCRGPHIPTTGHLGKGFKLLKVSGAYWRGDQNNAMLQRVYGTAWRTPKELKAYLKQVEEAEKRDHRRFGKEMDLFHFQEQAPGSVFWHPNGWILFQKLIDYMRKRQNEAGYQEINTPDIMDRSLWEATGHWDKFGENMFVTEAKEDRVFALKPMNCPGCVQVFKVFNQGIKSYRDLPMRLSEFGKVHRYEPSGALHGLMRVRAFTQDDAHIFCTEDQITQESLIVCDLILSIYRDFGFEDVRIKFSDRPELRVGDEGVWDKSEAALKAAVEATGLPYTYNPGEGAFYGPKLEFVLRDAIGRDWQCGTLQVDLNLPERLDATYIGEDGQKHRPVMLHRALFGSLERFAGILLEHYAGRLPLWLAPKQIVVATITSEADDYATNVVEQLLDAGLRATADIRNEKIGYKVREHSLAKVPVVLVAGQREADENTISMRRLGSKDNTTLALTEAVSQLQQEATTVGTQAT